MIKEKQMLANLGELLKSLVSMEDGHCQFHGKRHVSENVNEIRKSNIWRPKQLVGK
jgi:hypothetical protein